MQAQRLTNERIRVFSCPQDKTQKFLSDGACPGLYVRATPKGKKTYVFQWTISDKNKPRISIGAVGTWGLDDARKQAQEYQRLVDIGTDPREHLAQKKTEREKKHEQLNNQLKYSLEELCKQYVRHLEQKGKPSAKQAKSAFQHVKKSDLAARPANAIKPVELASLIRSVVDSGKSRMGGVLRSYLLAAYNAAIRSPLDPTSPSALTGFGIETNPVQTICTIDVNAGTRVLTREELQKFLAALGTRQSDRILKLALYAGGQRIEQLLRANREDWHEDTKTLHLLDPKGRRKTPRRHLIPLGPQASAMVADFAKEASEASDPQNTHQEKRLFPVRADTIGKRISAIAKELKIPKFDARDLRRTCETMLVERKISKEVRAHLLSHGLGGVQDKHYDMHNYAKEKRAALVRWEAHLNTILSKKTTKKTNQNDR